MPAYTANFASQLAPGLRVIFGSTYNERPTEFDKVFNVVMSKKNYEDDQELVGTGLVPTKPEGDAVSYDTIAEGYSKRYTHVEYGLGVIVTRTMYEDDLYGKIRKLTQGLARSGQHSIEIIGANVLNRAFNSTYKGGDGLELCSDVHTTKEGGTYRNELSNPADLSITSYEQMLIDVGTQFIDNRGLQVPARATKLVIAPANQWRAERILKSALLPETANNDYNPGQNSMPEGYQMMHWMTDTDAWFMKTDVPNGLTWMWRRKPDFSQDNEFDTDNAKYKTTFRCVPGWTDPRNIFGSPGA